MERRLAAILAADVVGYSRQVGADEAGTLARLTALRDDVFLPAVAAHQGRVFKTMGDGFLAEFASVVQALTCAIAVQTKLAERNAGATTPMQLRIGLHQGDVVVQGEDLMGDGVNVAARIEPLAEPGGIALSARVREDAHGRLDIDAEDIGEQTLKNISRTVQVFRIAPPGGAVALAEPVLALPDKPSIAVLPFANMSADTEQEYFADGVAEDIITELSRSRALFVIARNSSFTYRGKSVDIRQVGRELGVRYVLEGSVRRGGARIRVTTQLVEAATGHHLWAERYDRDLADIFTVQDEITQAVTQAIGPAISRAEHQRVARKLETNLNAWECYQRGLWHLADLTSAGNEQAESLFRRAITLDPMFASAHAGLARVLCMGAIYYRTAPVDEAGQLAEALARRAVQLDNDDPDAHAALAQALVLREEMDGAWASAEKAREINPNSARAQLYLGLIHIRQGLPAEGRAALELALRLSPREPGNRSVRQLICLSYFQERDYQGCVAAARQAVIMENANAATVARLLAASLGQLGRIADAATALRDTMTMTPELFDDFVRHRPPWYRPEDYEHVLEGLRKAGWKG